MSNNSFDARKTLRVGNKAYTYFDTTALAGYDKLPYSIRILLENMLRNEDQKTVTKSTIESMQTWQAKAEPTQEIAFRPARVLLQDFTGVPAVVDLASMRDAIQKLGGDPNRISPLQQVDLVIDHSVQVDAFGHAGAAAENTAIEFQRNNERYEFLKWGQGSFDNFRVVPPGAGIVHQVNLERLAPVVFEHNEVLYFDSVVGTDSHTTMINGLGVLGWGVGGIEAEAAMLGQPISMLVPRVVGFRLDGKMPVGATATDLVLHVVEILRKHGVVGKFVEFYGPGLASLSLADRATIANMAPEYGATCGLFPVDDKTLEYMRLTNRSDEQVAITEAYFRAQGLFDYTAEGVVYSENVSFDMAHVVPSLAGPKRPQDRVALENVPKNYADAFELAEGGRDARSAIVDDYEVKDGAVVIAAITSCTNTSNPSVLLAAGLLAKKAVALGLQSKPWVKTSLAPGSRAVTDYLVKAGLLEPLEQLGFSVVGYGCTTCIGNSGPLPEAVSNAIREKDLNVVSVLSGNRNFEGRVHPEVKMNYLASPPLVVAYALAGAIGVDVANGVLGVGPNGQEVTLADVWPSDDELYEAMKSLTTDIFAKAYDGVFLGGDAWQQLPVDTGVHYKWKDDSTYVRKSPFFDDIGDKPPAVHSIDNAQVLVMLGDSVTTDHISPAGSIKADSPAGAYLQSLGVEARDFNSYGARRGNHEVMMRGTFANIRLRNMLVPGTEGGVTKYMPSDEVMSIFDAAMRYKKENTPVIVIAGKEYGTGSSRDWAAKGVRLLNVSAVIAESFERIHRTNLVGMGVIPLEFVDGANAQSLALDGSERFSIAGINDGEAPTANVIATRLDGTTREFQVKVRIDTQQEVEYFRARGILQYVLYSLAA